MAANLVKYLVVSITYDGESHELHTYTNEYRSLMMLIYDKIYTEGFGDCLGMGKCGTCLVKVASNDHQLSYFDRNEETALIKRGQVGEGVHLSCQIMADEFIDGLKVAVL